MSSIYVLASIFFTSLQAAGADTLGFQPLLRLAVTDSAGARCAALSQHLRVCAQNELPIGWQLVARRTGAGANLLYHSRRWHGPYPTQIYAWSEATRRFPADRLLPVYGTRYELRVRCRDCTTVGDSASARFSGGTIEVAWRRAARAFPAASN